MTFTEAVFDIVRQIPKGKVLTYRQVAKLAGNEKAARAVGAILRSNRDKHIPCHRVVKTNGELGGYNGLRGSSKKALLHSEQAL